MGQRSQRIGKDPGTGYVSIFRASRNDPSHWHNKRAAYEGRSTGFEPKDDDVQLIEAITG